MNNKQFMVAVIALSCILFSACEPDEQNEPTKPSELTENSLYVLCEGNWGQTNSTIDMYSIDSCSVKKDFFTYTNGQGLGDTGNDMIAYGSKIYVAVKESHVISVINRQSGKLEKRIPIINDAGTGKSPSRLCSAKGKVYVACFSGSVVEIDTNSLSIEREVAVGKNPDGIAFANEKLYVSNSGGMDVVFDSTVSVIRLSDFSVIKTVNIGLNPTIAKTLPDGNVLIMLNGNYYDVTPSLVTINSQTDEVIHKDNVNVSSFAVCGNDVIFLHYNYITGAFSVKKAPYTNIANSTDFVSDQSVVSTLLIPYCVNVNHTRNEVYITDAKDFISGGEVLCFDYSGNLKYRFSTSTNPSIVVQK
ncbi:MAG: YncE family protein [Bacteroidales bacterium]|jgi:DNA-binding beta-propeller fold protein YncE|nr:YncE family protein [Bacteroidales bacterium]